MAEKTQLSDKEKAEWSVAGPYPFILANNIKNENGSPLEFDDHMFLVEPYLDMSPEQAIKKSSQIGWSVLAINKAIWVAKYLEANIIYTLPSKSIVKDFVVPKVDPIIEQNPIYKSMMGKNDSMALKSVGERFIYFRGSWEDTMKEVGKTSTIALSISAQVLISDEYDRSNQKVQRTYRTRLDDAKRERPDLGWDWKFSNPSIPGYGVDEEFEKSDQKHWFIRCSKCGALQFMSWPESINFEKEIYICKVCYGELSNEDRRSGQWVAKYPGRSISGYWINQMMCSWIPATKIIKDSKGDQQTFFNFTLGLAYISKDFSVTRRVITDCISPDTNNREDVVIGVDNGVTKTVVIGNAHGIFKIYETESWDDIEDDIKKYNAYCVIDANPYPATPIKLAEKYTGRVFIHFFNNDQKSSTVINWGEGEKRHVVGSDRTKVIDMLVQELVSKDILFNMTLTDLEQYIFDWTQLYRDVVTDAKGIAKAVWKTIEARRDHYAFATVYWRIALEKTFSGGEITRSPKKGSIMRRVVRISPEGTIPAIDIKEIIAKTERKKSWKTM